MKNLLQAFNGRRAPTDEATAGRYAILDIGTASVKALIVEPDGDHVVVLGSGQAAQSYGAMRDSLMTDLASVVECADAALNMAEEVAQTGANALILGLSAEQTRIATASLEIDRKHATAKLMAPELEDLIRQALRQALGEVAGQLASEAHVDSLDVRLINAALTHLAIDGHTVRNPINFQGKHVALSVVGAVAKLIHVGAMQTLAASIDMPNPLLVAEPFALAPALVSPLVRDLGAVYIDCGAGSTSITLVRGGRLSSYNSFAKGGLAFTRALAILENLSPEAADERKIAYSRGLLGDADAALVASALEGDLDEWAAEVSAVLNDMSIDERLPPFVYLVGGSSALPGLLARLNAQLRLGGQVFVAPPRIATLTAADLGAGGHQQTGPLGVEFAVALALARQACLQEQPLSAVDDLVLKIGRVLGPSA